MSTAGPAAIALTRAQVLGYRAEVHDLRRPARDPLGAGVLLAGVQDYPPGRTATAALRVRAAEVDATRLVLLQSVRGAPHLHRAADFECFATALRTLRATDLAKEQFGELGQELAGQRISLGWALDHVADAMRQVSADGRPRTKGELSTAVTPLVDARLRPWCPGCAVHHVQDALFRYATLQARLALAVQPSGFHYVPAPDAAPAPNPAESMTTLVRRFLRLCGPCRPEQLARWLALDPTAARRLWQQLADQLVAVIVDGRPCWAHHEELGELRDASAATEIRLLPPYDPLTELADRELLLPDRTRRSTVWRAVGNPGVLLVRGEIAGTYRQRATARRLTVTIQPFVTLAAADRRAALRHAESLAAPEGPPVEATFAS
ncbi:MAG: DNA glycosylase AlkZ-like family protein [Micromonosporaceae bacterium]